VLVDALIWLHGGEEQHFPMRTDEDGAFSVPAVLDPEQVQRVDVIALDPARGWATASVDARSDRSHELVLGLGTTGGVQIEIVDEAGDPLRGATLRLAMHYQGEAVPMHVYTGLPPRFYLPVRDTRFGFSGGVQAPSGHHCEQPGDGIFVAAYDLDDELLMAEEPRLVFPAGDPR
jgi:hypothetical protein